MKKYIYMGLNTAAWIFCAAFFLNAMWDGIGGFIGPPPLPVRALFDTLIYITIMVYCVYLKKAPGELREENITVCITAFCALILFNTSPLLCRMIFAAVMLVLLIRNELVKKEQKNTSGGGGDDSYYKSIEERYSRSRELWHDMRNHISVLNSYINRGDYEGMREYTSEFCCEIEKTIIPFRTGSIAADSVLADKLYLAKTHRINVITDPLVFPELKIKNTELCAVIANLFDNAIEACLRLEEDMRYIKIGTVNIDSSCYFKIENPCVCGDISGSSKPNSIKHGIGLRSVERIIHSCGGAFAASENNGIFKAVAELR